MAAVAVIPPKNGETIFPKPCASSSLLERCLVSVMLSKMTAQSSDSIAPNTAIEKAAGKRSCILSKFQLMISPCAFGIFQGKANSGKTLGMPFPVVPSAKV